MLAWLFSLILSILSISAVSAVTAVSAINSSHVQLVILPTQGYEPLTVYGAITIEPSYLDTWLCVLWDSDYGSSGSSCWQQDQYSTRTRKFTLKDLPAGSYSVIARLWREQKVISSDIRSVIIQPHSH